MKTIFFLVLCISSLHANDPTQLRGKLKDALSKQKAPPLKSKIKAKRNAPLKVLERDLQSEVNQLVFKAFYTKNSIKRLMLEFEKKIFLLEANSDITLKDEKYKVLNFNKDTAQFMHLRSKKTLTFIYRP